MRQCGAKQRAPGQDLVCLTPRVGYLSCVDRSIKTTWLLTPAEIFNFSLVGVCQTMMTEISLGCNCIAPPPPPSSGLTGERQQRSAERRNTREMKGGEKRSLLQFHYFLTALTTAYMACMPECDFTHSSHVSLTDSSCCHILGIIYEHWKNSIACPPAHPVLPTCSTVGW